MPQSACINRFITAYPLSVWIMCGTIRYQPTSASAAAWQRFIDVELADCRATDKRRRLPCQAGFVAEFAVSFFGARKLDKLAMPAPRTLRR